MTDHSRPRILITRLSHIGDCVLTLPLLCALRDEFPRAHIAWVVEKPSDKILTGHGALDELIALPRGWLKSPREVLRLRRRLRELRPDVAIDPQGLTKSAVAARLSGAATRIGFAPGRGRELAPLLENVHVSPARPHLVDASLSLLSAMGIDDPPVRFDLPVDAGAEAAIEKFVAGEPLAGGFALMNMGAGWPSKIWPGERFGLVARELWRRRALRSVIAWAGDKERAAAETALAAANGSAIPAPPTSLPELASLARRALVFIGCDTGPLHIAAAVGTRCVGLYGPTLPADCGPYGKGHVSVQAWHQHGPSRRRRRGPNDAMRAIDVETVAAACDEALCRRDAQSRAA